MSEEQSIYARINDIISKDLRYSREAYIFIMDTLQVTKHQLQREGHVSGEELSYGIKNFGLYLFGLMTKRVLESWGIYRTEDFGNIVYNLIEAGILGRSEEDSVDDFKDVFDFQEELIDKYPFRFGE